jgi:hypothetical protein
MNILFNRINSIVFFVRFKSIETYAPHSATSTAVGLVKLRERVENHREQKQELKRKYDVTGETNIEDDAFSSKQQKSKHYNESKKNNDDDKKEDGDYESED